MEKIIVFFHVVKAINVPQKDSFVFSMKGNIRKTNSLFVVNLNQNANTRMIGVKSNLHILVIWLFTYPVAACAIYSVKNCPTTPA